MRFKFTLIIVIFGMLFASCKKEITMQEYLVGNWQTKYMNLNMPTYQNSDSVYVIEDDFSSATATLAQSTYKDNGSFIAWYLTPKGEKKNTTSGTWNIHKDSLYIEFKVDNITTKASYFIEKTADGFQGKSLNDWDKDGAYDDVLIMKTKRLNSE